MADALTVIVALAATAGAVVGVIALSTRRRRTWDDSLRALQVDCRWFAGPVSQTLIDADVEPDEWDRTWVEAMTRLTGLSQRLIVLADSAPSGSRAAGARRLAAAVDRLDESLAVNHRLRTRMSIPSGGPSDRHLPQADSPVLQESLGLVVRRRGELLATCASLCRSSKPAGVI